MERRNVPTDCPSAVNENGRDESRLRQRTCSQLYRWRMQPVRPKERPLLPSAGPWVPGCHRRALPRRYPGIMHAAAGRQTGRVQILETLHLDEVHVDLRRATASDVPTIMGLLAADQLGATREGISCAEDLAAYEAAFTAIDRDPAHTLIVAQSGPSIVATMLLSFLPSLARHGACGPRSRPSGSTRPTAAAGSARLCSPGPSGKPAAVLRAGAAHDRQISHVRAPLLRTAGVHRHPRSHETHPLNGTAPI